MAKRRKRKPRLSKRVIKVSRLKRPEWQESPVPKSLFTAFKKVSKDDWENDKLYNKYRKLADEFLGVFADEGFESGKLIVCLSLMEIGKMNLDFSYTS